MVLTRAQAGQLRCVAKTGQPLRAHLLHLPDEILLIILAHLDTPARIALSAVCGRLHNLTHSPRLDNLFFSLDRNRYDSKPKSDEALTYFVAYWRECIKFVECAWDFSGDSEVESRVHYASVMPRLKTFSVIDRQVEVERPAVDIIHMLLFRSQTIENLRLTRAVPWPPPERAWGSEDDENAIKWTLWVLRCVASSPRLKEVHVAGGMFFLLPMNGISNLTGAQAKCTATSLKISDCRLISSLWPQDGALNTTPSVLTNLTRLYIDKLYTSRFDDISALAFCCNLESLQIMHALKEPTSEFQLDEMVSLAPLSVCTRLTLLHVGPRAHVNDVPRLPALKNLLVSLSGIKLNESGLLSADGIAPMTTCTVLCLDFRFPDFVFPFREQAAIPNLAVLEWFPRLRRLSLCGHFPPINGIECLSLLTHLVLDCRDPLPAEYRSQYPTPPLNVIGSCAHLKELHISTFEDVSDLSFLENCAALETVTICNLTAVGDDVINVLAGLPKLRILKLSGMPLTTVAGLITSTSLCRLVLRDMPTLKDISALGNSPTLNPYHLRVHSCGVSDRNVQRVQARLRRARQLQIDLN